MLRRSSRLCASMAGLLTAALAAAQGPTLRDHAGNMEVTGFSSFHIDKTGHFVGSAASGRKIHAVWKKQHLTLDAPSIEGTVGGSNQEGYKLQVVSVTGGIQAVAVRPSNSASREQTTTITGASATYKADSDSIQVTGGVKIHSTDTGASQKLIASGSSADIQLSQPGSKGRAIRSATVKGPVVMDMNGVRTADKEGKKVRLPFTAHGVADRLEFNDSAGTITLIGHVTLTGDDPSLAGADVENVSREVIHLAANGEIESIDLEGDPGTTTYREKDKPGGGGGRKRRK